MHKKTLTKNYQITIQNVSKMRIPLHAVLKRAAAMVLGNFVSQAELCIRITTEAESAQLNASYRHKKGPTNVLAFPLMFETPSLLAPVSNGENAVIHRSTRSCTTVIHRSTRSCATVIQRSTRSCDEGSPSHPPSPPLLGDLVLCACVVKQEAKQQNKSLSMHFSHMIVHGVLHLLGFDHQTDEDAEKMESLEIKCLKQLGFSNPYETKV